MSHMLNLITRLGIVLAVTLFSPAAHADIRIGDWRLVDGLGDETLFSLHAYYENTKDRSDVRHAEVYCEQRRWLLAIIAICKQCGRSLQFPLRVLIDGKVAFDVPASIADDISPGMVGPGVPGAGYIAKAELNADQLRALSEIKRSLTVESPGYVAIMLEPREGTAAAFQTLQTVCSATRADPTLRQAPQRFQ
jgi:hypothetical protein